MICKMVMIQGENDIILDRFTYVLGKMNIMKLNIFSINNKYENNIITRITSYGEDNLDSEVTYREMNEENFMKLIISETHNFLDYNKNSLYILRDGNFKKLKNMFSTINNTQVNIGKGAGQKSHLISPLELRLSSYLMAMFDFNYELITNLNSFHVIKKNQYLSYQDTQRKKDKDIIYKSIFIKI